MSFPWQPVQYVYLPGTGFLGGVNFTAAHGNCVGSSDLERRLWSACLVVARRSRRDTRGMDEEEDAEEAEAGVLEEAFGLVMLTSNSCRRYSVLLPIFDIEFEKKI